MLFTLLDSNIFAFFAADVTRKRSLNTPQKHRVNKKQVKWVTTKDTGVVAVDAAVVQNESYTVQFSDL